MEFGGGGEVVRSVGTPEERSEGEGFGFGFASTPPGDLSEEKMSRNDVFGRLLIVRDALEDARDCLEEMHGLEEHDWPVRDLDLARTAARELWDAYGFEILGEETTAEGGGASREGI